MIWLAPELERALTQPPGGRADIARIFNLPGRVYREPAGVNRRTLRFEAGGRGWFLKLHWGVGWGEIFKNLLSVRLPVLGAMHEWRAIRRLEALGVETMVLAGYGRAGFNPARLRSFVVTEELTETTSLEDYCADWPRHPPPPRLKWALIERLARVSRQLHTNGVNHRDYYLCHFLLRLPWDGDPASLRLPLIDLHRVQLRRLTPERWRVKDIGSLWFSAMLIGLTRRDRLRFVRAYGAGDLRAELKGRAGFWQAVQERALTLDRTRPPPAASPQRIALAADAGALTALQPVRVLPGKRWVGRAQWQGRAVYAKLFLDRKRARVHQRRELKGLRALAAAGIPTPGLLHAGESETERWPLVLLTPISPARSLAEAWPGWDRESQRRWMGRLVALLARQHAAGLIHTDPHLDNFLLSEDGLYTLDGAAVQIRPRPPGRAACLDNLALLLAQLAPDFDTWSRELEAVYRSARGWPGRGAGDLGRRVAAARERRWREFRGKLWRDCSRFERREHPYALQILERSLGDEALRNLLADPDASFPGAERALKNGNTSTVWATEAGGRRLVIKRYNVKNPWHGLKLSLRRSRAFASWEAAQRLAFFGIATPRPVALVRLRRGRLRPLAYYVSEHLPGPDALSWFRDPSVDWAAKQAMAVRISRLLGQLKAERLVHGDLKATNFLIGPDGPVLIDLDALRQYRSGRRFARAWRKDLARFARNWADQPELARLFAGHLAPL